MALRVVETSGLRDLYRKRRMFMIFNRLTLITSAVVSLTLLGFSLNLARVHRSTSAQRLDPQDSRIAFAAHDIYLMDSDGSNIIQLTSVIPQKILKTDRGE